MSGDIKILVTKVKKYNQFNSIRSFPFDQSVAIAILQTEVPTIKQSGA